MSKSILTIDTPKGCVFCPLAEMRGFKAFHNYAVKQETIIDRQPYMGITCPFCNGIRYIYNLTADEVLTYKHAECPLRESEDREELKMEYTKENLEKILRDMTPDLVGTYAKNFRETVLQENIPKFAKGTEISLQSIYNFENGSNVSYRTFYEYVKRGFLTYIFG